MSEYQCKACGGATADAPARTQRHGDICTCRRCEQCGGVYGSDMEGDEWNDGQLAEHNLSCIVEATLN